MDRIATSHIGDVGSGTAEAAAVHVRGACKSYPNVDVLRDMTFEMPAGQRVAIIGPSGSGKTTILRCLMTLETLDAGSIAIHGSTVEAGVGGPRDRERALRAVRANVGMVFQQFNLFPHLSAIANVTMAPMRVLGREKERCVAEAQELLGLVGISEKADAYPGQLSGGQQQRVAIARALAMNPKVMLFDEVTSALDPELVGEVLDAIRRIAAASNMTMLFVTHEMDFAADITDRVLFVEDGRIVEDNPPEIIFRSPESDRTQTFLRMILER